MTTIAERLRTVREEKRLTCRGLSERAGVAQALVGQIERGKVRDPGAKTLVALSRVLDVSIDWLVTGEESSHNDRDPSAGEAA